MFSWGTIIAKQLNDRIEQAQNPQPGEVSSLYMASYLLYVMCVQNIFSEMNLNWHVSEPHVHVYMKTLMLFWKPWTMI